MPRSFTADYCRESVHFGRDYVYTIATNQAQRFERFELSLDDPADGIEQHLRLNAARNGSAEKFRILKNRGRRLWAKLA